jgi:hypothetical protein
MGFLSKLIKAPIKLRKKELKMGKKALKRGVTDTKKVLGGAMSHAKKK